jgi:hypothetical protein
MSDRHYNQTDYNIALGIGLLAGACVGGAIGMALCALVVGALGL